MATQARSGGHILDRECHSSPLLCPCTITTTTRVPGTSAPTAAHHCHWQLQLLQSPHYHSLVLTRG